MAILFAKKLAFLSAFAIFVFVKDVCCLKSY